MSLRKRPEAVYRAGAHIGRGQVENVTSEYAVIQKEGGKFVVIPQEDILVKRLP